MLSSTNIHRVVAAFVLMLSISIASSQPLYNSSKESFDMLTPTNTTKVKSSRKESERPVVFSLVSPAPREGKFNRVKMLLDAGSSGSFINEKTVPSGTGHVK